MGGSVAMASISELPEGLSYQLYFDNLFMSLKLLDELSPKAMGITKVNQVEKCPIADPREMKKSKRGHFDHGLVAHSGTALVQWHDNSIVTIVSNWHGVTPIGKVKRWSAAQKRAIEVSQPHLFAACNRGMVGTDRMDEKV